jgi:hypothetical protein
MIEQRYREELEVLDGSPVNEVAMRYGVSRQPVYSWRARDAAAGIDGLRTSLSRLPAETEALVCELRRAPPQWVPGGSRSRYGKQGAAGAPSRATMHRVLLRNAMVTPQTRQHKRKYRRWQRETPMALWQLDPAGGIYLADGRECKLLSGIDNRSPIRRLRGGAGLSVGPGGRRCVHRRHEAVRSPGGGVERQRQAVTGQFTRPARPRVLFGRVCC